MRTVHHFQVSLTSYFTIHKGLSVVFQVGSRLRQVSHPEVLNALLIIDQENFPKSRRFDDAFAVTPKLTSINRLVK